MAIKGWSDVVRFPRLGEIRLGEKDPNGYPRPLDYFVAPAEVHEVYGEQPREMDIMFPHDDIEVVTPAALKRYGEQWGLICKGDGEVATLSALFAQKLPGEYGLKSERGRFVNGNGEPVPVAPGDDKRGWVQIPCAYQGCSHYQAGKCREIVLINVLLPKVAGVLGVYTITTGSFHSYTNLKNALGMLRHMVGRISFVPLKLKVRLQEAHPEVNDKRIKRAVPVMYIDMADMTMERMIQLARQNQLAMVAQSPLPVEVEPADEQQVPELFYPGVGGPAPAEAGGPSPPTSAGTSPPPVSAGAPLLQATTGAPGTDAATDVAGSPNPAAVGSGNAALPADERGARARTSAGAGTAPRSRRTRSAPAPGGADGTGGARDTGGAKGKDGRQGTTGAVGTHGHSPAPPAPRGAEDAFNAIVSALSRDRIAGVVGETIKPFDPVTDADIDGVRQTFATASEELRAEMLRAAAAQFLLQDSQEAPGVLKAELERHGLVPVGQELEPESVIAILDLNTIRELHRAVRAAIRQRSNPSGPANQSAPQTGSDRPPQAATGATEDAQPAFRATLRATMPATRHQEQGRELISCRAMVEDGAGQLRPRLVVTVTAEGPAGEALLSVRPGASFIVLAHKLAASSLWALEVTPGAALAS